MAPPPPVLDKYKRIIPLLDPYAESALDNAYGEQYGKIFKICVIKQFYCLACTPWFAPGVLEKRFCAENDTMIITLHYAGYPHPKIQWKFRGWDIDATSSTSNIRFK